MKHVLITGGSRGIGLAMTKTFLGHDYLVYANYNKTKEKLQALKDQLNPSEKERLIPIQADLSSAQGVDQLFSQIDQPIDILINNVGLAEFKLFDKITEEDWDHIFAVNLKSYFLSSQKVVPQMIARKSGCIINVSSIWGLTGASLEVHYSTAKAGIIGLTKSLAKELAPCKIRVNAIAPGVIDTAMLAALDESEQASLKKEIPLQRFGKPEEVAETALFLAQQEYITGEVININGGLLI